MGNYIKIKMNQLQLTNFIKDLLHTPGDLTYSTITNRLVIEFDAEEVQLQEEILSYLQEPKRVEYREAIKRLNNGSTINRLDR